MLLACGGSSGQVAVAVVAAPLLLPLWSPGPPARHAAVIQLPVVHSAQHTAYTPKKAGLGFEIMFLTAGEAQDGIQTRLFCFVWRGGWLEEKQKIQE